MITRRKPHSDKAVVCNMYKYEVAAPTIGACYFFYLCNLRIGNLPMSIHITYEHSMSSVRISGIKRITSHPIISSFPGKCSMKSYYYAFSYLHKSSTSILFTKQT